MIVPWILCAVLLTLLVFVVVLLLFIVREFRISLKAQSLWWDRAFRLRNRLHQMGVNWRFEDLPADGIHEG